MKKRKIYEISVIDRTYSKIISDETKFYTSDTALELVFKLKETEYNFESAEIVLLNIDDRSLTTRPVSKVNNDFTYELDDDVIAHHGEWHGQLRFEAGEIYVSSPVKFRIENDLSNDRPPQLSDVQSWVSLKRYADSLTEELKQAVLEVEGMDDTFNANELERQSTFEVNESERNQTFESNELTRQTQELEREKAEAKRQTAFDGNETIRTETFNANEDIRQENETTRQTQELEREKAESQRQSTFEANEIERQTTFETAEQERQSAELMRVENEKQRNLTSVDEFIKLQDSIGGRNYATENYSVYNIEGTYGYRKIAEIGENVTAKIIDKDPNIELPLGTYFGLTGNGINFNKSGQWLNSDNREFTRDNLPFFSFFPNNANSLKIIMDKYYVKVEKGTQATPYTKPPEDYEVVSKEDYYNHVELMNEFKENQFNQLKQAVIALGGTI